MKISELREMIREELQEAYSVDIDKLLQNPKIKKLMKRLGVKKSQSKEGALKILNYFANNPHALTALKKIAFESTTTSDVPGYQTPFAFKKKEDDEDDKNESVNELSMAPFSSSEAKLHINADIKDMSKHLGKASQQVIKIMMDGVKGGKYTAMDISRGIKEGPASRTHFGEMTFIQSLWNKMREKFRKYSKDGKLS